MSSSIYRKHSAAQRNQPCTKQQSTYVPIRARQRKQADRELPRASTYVCRRASIRENQHYVVEHLPQPRHSTAQSTMPISHAQSTAKHVRADQSVTTQVSRHNCREPACKSSSIQRCVLKETKHARAYTCGSERENASRQNRVDSFLSIDFFLSRKKKKIMKEALFLNERSVTADDVKTNSGFISGSPAIQT